jgi:hypothetical protein
MSLVIASNQDNEITIRNNQSIFTSYSFRNALSSTYKIPPKSQVCLQSAKVNLDSRITLGGANGTYYDWFGEELDETPSIPDAIDYSTSYPTVQQFTKPGRVEELTTEELTDLVKAKHKEYYPNRMGHHDVEVKRHTSGAFEGYDFKYGFNNSQSNACRPSSFQQITFFDDDETRFNYTAGTGVFQRINLGASEDGVPCAGLGLGHPLSLSNGSMVVNFANANASGVQWGIGLSRGVSFINNMDTTEDFKPPYMNFNEELATTHMDLDSQDYYADFSVHRNASGELVVRQSSTDGTGQLLFSEVEYWDNADSDLNGSGRFDIATNSPKYDLFEFRVEGEKVSLYIKKDVETLDLVCKVDTISDKATYFKPVQQTCWCLHPVLFVGKSGSNLTNSLTITGFSGMNIAGYDSNSATSEYKGWYESADIGANQPYLTLQDCRRVDFRRALNDPTFSTKHTYKGLNASNITAYTPGMIVSPNDTYIPSSNAVVAEIFGFPTRSLVNVGTYNTSGSIVTLTIRSDSIPPFQNTKSIFVRLNGFGQQVLNAKTGNQSTILAHLPTAEIKEQGLFFYEPHRDIWLDLNNPYEITTSDISIDFVYSNEQYAKILQGQSIVVLYFRQKP